MDDNMAYHSKTGFVFSLGNNKMGKVASFSVMPKATCPEDVPCGPICYANKMAVFRLTVRNSYKKNTDLLRVDNKYPELVQDTVDLIRFKGIDKFRWNVSGDIFSEEYLWAMIQIANKCPSVKFWVFTKQFKILENALSKYQALGLNIPTNLNIILSAWGDYQPPESLKKRFGVNYFGDKEGKFEIPEGAFVCQGNCEECLHCAEIKAGESMVIHQH